MSLMKGFTAQYMRMYDFLIEMPQDDLEEELTNYSK